MTRRPSNCSMVGRRATKRCKAIGVYMSPCFSSYYTSPPQSFASFPICISLSHSWLLVYFRRPLHVDPSASLCNPGSQTKTRHQSVKMCLTTYQEHDCGHTVVVHLEKCPRAVAKTKSVCDRKGKEILSTGGPSGFNCRVCYPVVS